MDYTEKTIIDFFMFFRDDSAVFGVKQVLVFAVDKYYFIPTKIICKNFATYFCTAH